MEYCEKSTLRGVIDDRELIDAPSSQRAWRLFRETLYGLAYVHAQGLIHRDIKPVCCGYSIFVITHTYIGEHIHRSE
jgi:translation initiation factor 2-alpha kinase 4